MLLLVVLKVTVALQVFRGGPDKGQLAGGTKGDADGNVLALGPFGIEGGRVVVKWLCKEKGVRGYEYEILLSSSANAFQKRTFQSWLSLYQLKRVPAELASMSK